MAVKQNSLELLKDKIKRVDADVAIHKHDLKKDIDELKESCDIGPDEVDQYLIRLKKKIVRLEQEEEGLYSKADGLLRKINNARS